MSNDAFSHKLLGLYIHWPFCLSKCPYCDFNSHVVHTIPHKEYAKALCLEIEYYLQRTNNKELISIFFGGGTPSLMEASTIEKIISTAQKYINFSPNIEITLEANPTSVESQKFITFKQAGINRLSLGIQSLNPVDLKRLGRHHSVNQALDSLALAHDLFDNVSFDLIYAREGQSLKDWEKELVTALSIARDHLSLYQLTIEPKTLFEKQHQQGILHLPTLSLSRDMFLLTEELTKKYHFNSYEISNYAHKNKQCQHNLLYWRYEDYIGVGPGAHGRISINQELYAIENYRNPQQWLNMVFSRGQGIYEKECLTSHQKAMEMLLMGLRLEEGVHKEQFEKRCGIDILTFVDPQRLEALIEEKYLSWDHRVLKTTPQGKLRLNAILNKLLI